MRILSERQLGLQARSVHAFIFSAVPDTIMQAYPLADANLTNTSELLRQSLHVQLLHTVFSLEHTWAPLCTLLLPIMLYVGSLCSWCTVCC